MTSKNSSLNQYFDLHLIKDTIRKNAWLITLAFVISFFAMPVATALQLQNLTPEGSNPTWYAQRLNEILEFAFTISNPLLIAMFSGAALISAAVVFKFLHNRNQVDFFHSLPVKRERLFITNYVAGMALIILPYLANALLTLAVIAAFGKLGSFPALSGLWGACQHLLFFAAIYSVVVLAAVLTGNGVINVLLSPVLLGIGPALVGIYMLTMTTFYSTFYDALFPIDQWLTYTSPFTKYIFSATNPLTWKGALVLLIFIGVMLLLSLKLYLRRPSEAAGNALAFRITRPVIKYPLVFIATSIMGLAFYSASNMQGELFWLLFGFVCGAFISNAIIEIIYHFDFKAIKGNYRGLCIFFVLFLALYSLPVFDLTGYDSYRPQKEQIASVRMNMSSVDDYGISSRYYYSPNYTSTRDRQMAQLDRGLLTDEENIQAALNIIDRGVQYTTDYESLTSEEKSDYYRLTSLNVVYTFTNAVARQYSVPIALAAEDISHIIDSPEYKLNHFDIFQLTDAEADALTIESVQNLENQPLFQGENLTPAVKNALLEAYKSDFMSLNSEVLKTQPPLGLLHLEFAYTNANGSASTYSMHYPVFSTFNHTLTELEALGISREAFQKDTSQITHLEINVYDYDEYDDEPDMEHIYTQYSGYGITVSDYNKGHAMVKITDPGEIAKVIAESWPNQAFDYSPFFSPDHSQEINVFYATDTESYTLQRYYKIQNF